MLGRDEAQSLCDKVLASSAADQAELWLTEEDAHHLRYARNTPSTSGNTTNPTVTVRSAFGTRSASASVNQLDDDSLAQVVRRSEELARLAPEDPEFVPALGPQPIPDVAAFDAVTAEQGPLRMAQGVARCLGDARERDLVAAGFTATTSRVDAVASSAGLFGYHASTSAYASETARTPDGAGSGWAAQASHRIENIDYATISQRALGKAVASASKRPPEPLPPGSYTTILEAACVANLVQYMVYGMSARLADVLKSSLFQKRQS